MKNRLFYGADEPDVLKFIDADKIRREEQRTIVIVPDQYKLEMEQKLGKKFGGALLHISVMSFAGLAGRVCAFEEVVPITALGRQMFISAAMDMKKAELKAFSKNINKNGFIEELGSILSEMTAPIEVTQDCGAQLADKISDINAIFEAYSEISQGGYIGDENMMILAAKLAAKSDIIKNSKFYVSKYTHFSDSEHELFRALLDFSRGVDMTLHYAEGEKVFAYTARLFDAMPSNIVAEPEARDSCTSDAVNFANAVFRQDEAELAKLFAGKVRASADGKVEYGGAFVEVYEAADRKDEILFAAAEIRKMIAAGANPSEITIVCPSLDKYLGILELAMDRYDLPYFIDADRAFPRTPLRRFVDALLDYSASASAASVQKLLATELLPLTEQQTNQLLLDLTEKKFMPAHAADSYTSSASIASASLYAPTGGADSAAQSEDIVCGSASSADLASASNPALSASAPASTPARSASAPASIPALSASAASASLHAGLRQMLRALSLRHLIKDDEVDLRAFIRELYAVLTKDLAPAFASASLYALSGGADPAAQSEDIVCGSAFSASSFASKPAPRAPRSIMSQCEQHSYKLRRINGETSLEVEFGARIWNSFVAMLEQLNELAARVHSIPVVRLRAMISSHMGKVTVSRIPSHAEYVTVAPVGRVRPERSKYIVLIGAVRGELPQISAKTKVLSLDEQNTLLNTGGVRRFRAFEDPEREAYKLYCLLTAPREKLIITYPNATKSAVLNVVLSAVETAVGVRDLRFPKAEYAARILQKSNKPNPHFSVPKYPKKDLIKRLFEQTPEQSSAFSPTDAEDMRVRLSSSSIDEYLACPYKYMMNRLIKADTLDVYELDGREAGNIVHHVLEKYARRYWHAHDGERPEESASDVVFAALGAKRAEIRSRVCEILDSAHKVGMDTALYRARFVDAITQYICALEYQLMMGEYTVAECEKSIGFVQPLDETLDGKRCIAEFVGKIDRVDFCSSGEYYRLIDYKTGEIAGKSKSGKKTERAEIDIQKFFSLEYTQLLLYMYALNFASSEDGENPDGENLCVGGENSDGENPDGADYGGRKCAGAYIFSANDRLGIPSADEEFGNSAAKAYRLSGITLAEEDAMRAMCDCDGCGETVYDGFDILADEEKCSKSAFKSAGSSEALQLELYREAVAKADESFPDKKPCRDYLAAIGTEAYAAVREKCGAVCEAVLFEFSKKIINTVAGGILRCEFEICAGEHCRYCSYQALCLSGGAGNE